MELIFIKRASGVLMHISSLWGDYSSGSFGVEAKRWVDYLSNNGFTYWQVLPFTLPDECFSPYKSYSTFSGNPFFIDLPSLVEEGLLTESELRDARQFSPYLCEFSRLAKERINLLKKAAERACETQDMKLFFEKHKHCDTFCRFMALKEANSMKEWPLWETELYSEDALFAGRFIEYTFFKQWFEIKDYANKKGVKIIGDIPMYVAFDSSDVWSNKDQFKLSPDLKPLEVAGVPPDYFSKDGQLWGNPLYDWDKMKKDGYSFWKDRMSFMCECFDGVRIDHFRALESYFSIPAEDTNAKRGKWIKGPGIEFIDEIKKISKDKLIIAEDLGDITPEVMDLVEKSGFPGMRVLQFAFLGDENSPHLPHNYENLSVAYTGTHDNNTLLGYVWEMDDNTRHRFLDYFGHPAEDWNNCYDTVLRSVLRSHAGLTIFPVQDLLKYGSDTRLNTPGVSEKNWGYRLTKEQFESLKLTDFSYLNKLYSRI